MSTVQLRNESSYTIDLNEIAQACHRYVRLISTVWDEYVWRVVDDANRHGFQLVVVDDLDQADALGYHDLGPDGKPYALIGARVCVENGVELSTVITHELGEMVGDPLANRWASNGRGTLYAQELADPVEGDSFDIGGVLVSDFVYPSYFNPYGEPPYDHMGLLETPFDVRSTGYAIIEKEGKVDQLLGEDMPEWKKLAKSSRRSFERAYRRGVRS